MGKTQEAQNAQARRGSPVDSVLQFDPSRAYSRIPCTVMCSIEHVTTCPLMWDTVLEAGGFERTVAFVVCIFALDFMSRGSLIGAGPTIHK